MRKSKTKLKLKACSTSRLLSPTAKRFVSPTVPVNILFNGLLKFVMLHVGSMFMKRKNICFRTLCLGICTRRNRHLIYNHAKINTPHDVHFSRTGFQDLFSALFIRQQDFNFPTNTSTKQLRVKDIDDIGGHQTSDVLCYFASVQLFEEF